ncbi:MAG: DNA cytosine methyltransferase [Lachnospiraceae bacterium]|nr:DNA cytosine methyltransferase [Lachnospiraceae bacterium]
MTINEIIKFIQRKNWGKRDFRALKQELLKLDQNAIIKFSPRKEQILYKDGIQVIDLFCGAGGTSLGFVAMNDIFPVFNILGGCDINAVSAETYSHNYSTPLLNEDIVKLAYEDGKLDEFLEKIGYNKELPCILIGCAPCQGFSSHRKKHWNEEDDARNSLIIAFSKIVEHILPDVIIMENVPEFLSERYWSYFSSARGNFEKAGYIVKQNIYNAATFGVPQERFRSVIIGMKKDFLLPEEVLQKENFRTVRDAIGALPKVDAGVAAPNDPMHKSAAHKASTINVIKSVPHNGGSRPEGVGPACLDRIKGFSDVYGRLYWDRPSITITHYARNPASGRYSHPEQDRGLTAREAALLQSFPNGFEFMGKSDDIYRQIGEAVPPFLSAAIATNVLIELISKEPAEEERIASPISIEKPVSSSYSSVIAGIKIKERA